MVHPAELKDKKLLFACFDWGLGHLSRSVSLIRQLEVQGNELFFLGSEEQIAILKIYGFQGRTQVHTGSNLAFKGSGNFIKEGFLNLMKGPKFIRRDKAAVKAALRTFPADYVISDHRYGFSSKKAHSIFLTHQVVLPEETPRLVSSLHRNWLFDFKTVWILDDEYVRLAGNLSACPKNGCYIGHYSRFSPSDAGSSKEELPVGIISGPEPYARQLFDLLERMADLCACKMVVICPEGYTTVSQHLQLVHDWREADEWIRAASWIFSRNGYSTLMDLKVLNKKALLLVTPGQTEQLYLSALSVLESVQTVTSEAAFVQRFTELFDRNSAG